MNTVLTGLLLILSAVLIVIVFIDGKRLMKYIIENDIMNKVTRREFVFLCIAMVVALILWGISIFCFVKASLIFFTILL